MDKPPLRYTLFLAWCLVLKHEALLVFNYSRERQDRTFLRRDWREKVTDRVCITHIELWQQLESDYFRDLDIYGSTIS